MFSNISQTYNLSDASLEIIIMLGVTFVLGYLLAYFVHRCNYNIWEEYIGVSTGEKQIDNLKIIEWIGPKIESLLNTAGVYTFSDIVDSGIEWLEKILEKAGSKYQMHNPQTWPDQAELAMQWKWTELKEYQDLLSAGRESK